MKNGVKVSFDGIEGYIKTSNLTSSYTTPNIVEKIEFKEFY